MVVIRLTRQGSKKRPFYSIVAAEWPAVRAHLEWQLAKPR